jgi:hypothetical protein
MEHITTMDAVNFVESCEEGICGQNDLILLPFSMIITNLYNISIFPGHVAATVTLQHLLNRNALFQGGLQPHNYCLPILKGETHSMCNPPFKKYDCPGKERLESSCNLLYMHSSGEIVPMFTGSTLEWLPSNQDEE